MPLKSFRNKPECTFPFLNYCLCECKFVFEPFFSMYHTSICRCTTSGYSRLTSGVPMFISGVPVLLCIIAFLNFGVFLLIFGVPQFVSGAPMSISGYFEFTSGLYLE